MSIKKVIVYVLLINQHFFDNIFYNKTFITNIMIIILNHPNKQPERVDIMQQIALELRWYLRCVFCTFMYRYAVLRGESRLFVV